MTQSTVLKLGNNITVYKNTYDFNPYKFLGTNKLKFIDLKLKEISNNFHVNLAIQFNSFY